MKAHKFLGIWLLAICISANAQTTFHKSVSIEFEKRVAVWPLMKEMESEWFEQEKNNFPKEVFSYFNFSSNGSQSIYKRTKEADLPRNSWYRPIADENIIF